MKELSEQFVCVRLVKCNGLDLSLFQFCNDLTFGAFFLNADRTIYARYGYRSAQDGEKDVAINGLAETMKNVLETHENYPESKGLLAGKQPKPTEKNVPEEFTALDHFSPRLDYEKQVAKGCVHCHQILDAERSELRSAGEKWSQQLMLPYPGPSTVGIEFNVDSASQVEEVRLDSFADKSGVHPRDTIVSLDGQAIFSSADFVWVLHHCEDKANLDLVVNRDSETIELKLELPVGWRDSTDLSWRPTSWDMRRMATGGVIFEPLNDDQRRAAGVVDGQMALRAKHVGMYGNHARAKRAGIKKGDLLLGVDGKTDLLTEAKVLAYAIQEKKAGEKIRFDLKRNGRKFTATIKLQ